MEDASPRERFPSDVSYKDLGRNADSILHPIADTAAATVTATPIATTNREVLPSDLEYKEQGRDLSSILRERQERTNATQTTWKSEWSQWVQENRRRPSWPLACLLMAVSVMAVVIVFLALDNKEDNNVNDIRQSDMNNDGANNDILPTDDTSTTMEAATPSPSVTVMTDTTTNDPTSAKTPSPSFVAMPFPTVVPPLPTLAPTSVTLVPSIARPAPTMATAVATTMNPTVTIQSLPTTNPTVRTDTELPTVTVVVPSLPTGSPTASPLAVTDIPTTVAPTTEPPTARPSVPISFVGEPFTTPMELRNAILEYYSWQPNGDNGPDPTSSVALRYGFPIDNWDVSQVRSMRCMFHGMTAPDNPCSDFPVNGADMAMHSARISSWTFHPEMNDMSYMFAYASDFNAPIGSWSTSQVTTMSYMFWGANAFNQDISSWDVGRVRDFRFMFLRDYDFNQDLSSWNVSSATNLHSMFELTSFNQNLCAWGPRMTAAFIDTREMFLDATLCPTMQDPDLTASPPGPFCYPC